MTFAQIVFILILPFIGRFLIKKENKLISRVFIVLLVIIGIISIIQPSLTSFIAQKVGIGRGTDLVLYMYIFASLLIFGSMRNKIVDLNRTLTKITREIAIMNAKSPDQLNIDDNSDNQGYRN
jgi:hypothetical protein